MSVKRLPKLKKDRHHSGGSGYNWTNGHVFSDELPTLAKKKNRDGLKHKKHVRR